MDRPRPSFFEEACNITRLPTSREIAASVANFRPADVTRLPRRPGPEFWNSPRGRFLGAVTRLEHAGVEEGAACRRIYSSFLADEIALPDQAAIASCIRILAGIDDPEVTTALVALADMLSPLGGEAA